MFFTLLQAIDWAAGLGHECVADVAAVLLRQPSDISSQVCQALHSRWRPLDTFEVAGMCEMTSEGERVSV